MFLNFVVISFAIYGVWASTRALYFFIKKQKEKFNSIYKKVLSTKHFKEIKINEN